MSELKYTSTQMNNVLSSSQEYYRNWKEAEKINIELRARISELSQAVGLITTLKPTMVMDVDHPLDMAKEVEAYVTARIAELEESDNHWAGNVKVCMQLVERYESRIAELERLIERLIDIGDWATVGMVISNLYSRANEMEMREFAAKRRDEWKTLVKDWKEREE